MWFITQLILTNSNSILRRFSCFKPFLVWNFPNSKVRYISKQNQWQFCEWDLVLLGFCNFEQNLSFEKQHFNFHRIIIHRFQTASVEINEISNFIMSLWKIAWMLKVWRSVQHSVAVKIFAEHLVRAHHMFSRIL